MTAPTQRRDVQYSGHVQGVGFRYTTQAIARGFEVTGWVQNLADGRVALAVEGEKDQVTAFLTEISSRLGHFIRETREDIRPATGHFTRFEIR